MTPKVLMVGKYFYPARGGMEQHMLDHVRSLKDSFDFELVVHNEEKKLSVEDFEGVKLTRVPVNLNIGSAPVSFSFVKILREFKGDLIVIHVPNPIALLSYWLSGTKTPMVVVYHYDITRQKIYNFFYRPLQNFLLSKAKKIVATADNNVRYSPVLSRVADRCSVIPLGIEISSFDKTPTVEKEVQAIRNQYQGKIVLFIGRLTYYKGLGVLLDAARDADFQVLIIGKGHEQEELQKHSEGCDNIFFLSAIDDILPYYYAADIFVLPSIARSEAFGIVQLESMATSTPVVTTTLKTGVPEVQVHGETGLLVEPGDAEGLRKAIDTLLADPDMIERMGNAGRKRLEECYDLKVIKKMYEELYTKAAFS